MGFVLDQWVAYSKDRFLLRTMRFTGRQLRPVVPTTVCFARGRSTKESDGFVNFYVKRLKNLVSKSVSLPIQLSTLRNYCDSDSGPSSWKTYVLQMTSSGG